MLNWHKAGIPFFNISEEHIQIIHNGANHCSNDRVQMCDSLIMNLTLVIKNCLKALYRTKVEKNGKLSVTIVPVQKQNNGYNCGLFAIVSPTNVLDGFSPARFLF